MPPRPKTRRTPPLKRGMIKVSDPGKLIREVDNLLNFPGMVMMFRGRH